MKDFANSLLSLWKQLGLNQRVTLCLAALVVIGGLIGLAVWSRQPDFQLLYGKLSDKDAAAIISQLQAQGIKHKVSGGGSTVYVPADQVYRLRMDLAAKSLPSGDSVGFEIFDRGQFGLSDFVQRTNYLRALQGELARTISQLDGVASARVMIVQPENRLLLTDQSVKPSASVFIELASSRLEPEAVNSIRNLVANAVQGLSLDQVAVVDQKGRVLSEELRQDPTLGTASSQMRYRQQVEDYFAKKVEGLLLPVVGSGNAIVRVSAEIDTDATTLTQEKFDPDGQVVRSQTSTEDTTNSIESRAGGGTVGVSANTPAAAGGSPSGDGPRPMTTNEQSRKNRTTAYEINRKNRTTAYEINRTVTNTTRNPGSVKSLTAAVFISQRSEGVGAAAKPLPRSPDDLQALRQIVVNALGLRAQPGQSLDQLVSLQEMPFQVAAQVSEEIQSIQRETRIQGWFDTASKWFPAVAALGLLAFFWSMLKKQRPEPVPMEMLTGVSSNPQQTLQANGMLTPEILNELIRQKPINIGTALRDWATPKKN